MAWSRKKVDSKILNNNSEYTKNSQLSAEALNGIVNSGLYSQDFVEHLADTPDVSEAGNVGTPTVTLVDNPNATTDKPYKRFKFANLKGAKGDKGDKGDRGDSGEIYQSTGASTTGAMSQNATTEELKKKLSLSGGTMAGDIMLPAGKFIVDEAGYGLVGYYGTDSATYGNPNRGINLRGNTTRPQYNSADIALLSDMADRIVETYISSDGNTWYRIWSSGWKECGFVKVQTSNSGNRTMTLPISFTNVNSYTVAGAANGSGYLTTFRLYQSSANSVSFAGGDSAGGYRSDCYYSIYCCGY
jgi:hypothetical protein